MNGTSQNIEERSDEHELDRHIMNADRAVAEDMPRTVAVVRQRKRIRNVVLKHQRDHLVHLLPRPQRIDEFVDAFILHVRIDTAHESLELSDVCVLRLRELTHHQMHATHVVCHRTDDLTGAVRLGRIGQGQRELLRSDRAEHCLDLSQCGNEFANLGFSLRFGLCSHVVSP